MYLLVLVRRKNISTKRIRENEEKTENDKSNKTLSLGCMLLSLYVDMRLVRVDVCVHRCRKVVINPEFSDYPMSTDEGNIPFYGL